VTVLTVMTVMEFIRCRFLTTTFCCILTLTDTVFGAQNEYQR
jgi:hypothetical protein